MDLVSIRTASFMSHYHRNLPSKDFDNFFSHTSPKHSHNTRLTSKNLKVSIVLELAFANLFQLPISGPFI